MGKPVSWQWTEVEYAEVPLRDARLEAYLNAVRALYVNGKVLLKCLRDTGKRRVHALSEVIPSSSSFGLIEFFNARTVRRALKDLQLPSGWTSAPAHFVYSGFEFEGALTATLLSGGAYVQFQGSEDDARQLSRDFMSVVGRNHRVVNVAGAWTPWFYDVACSTFFVFDSTQSLVWILCLTDTD